MISALLCDGETPLYAFYAADIPQYIYYIFLPSIVGTLMLGLFVYLKGKKKRSVQVFFFLTVIMCIWMVSMLGNWAENNPARSIFYDQFNILISVIAVVFIYFLYVTFYEKQLSFSKSLLIFGPLLPIFVLYPTSYNVESIELGWCETTSGKLYWYIAFLLIVYVISGFILLIKKIRAESHADNKKLLWMVFAGFFVWTLLSVVLGIIFPVVGYPQSTLWAPISCLLFVGAMSWAIVKYEFLDVKTFAAQILTVAIWIMVASQFFFIRTTVNRILTGITLLLLSIFGWWLVRSVKDEIKKKEEIQDLAEKLNLAYEKMKQLDRAKSEFVSIASHQLRTPLTSIKGFISLVLEGSYGRTTRAVREVLEKVYVSNERLIRLVEDLLNISRIESGRLVFKFEKNDVGQMVADIVESMSFAAKNKGLYLDLKLPKNLVPEFVFDKDKIREVVTNLIDNAIKYTKKGGITVFVREVECDGAGVEQRGGSEIVLRGKCQQQGNFVQIIAADTGIGIQPGEEKYIFEKFQRGKDINRVHTEGIGLGLYVAEKIIQAHKGRIWAESGGIGKGSRFIVELDKNFVAPPAEASENGEDVKVEQG